MVYDYRKICDHLYDGIHISDGRGVVLYVNPAYTRTTGVEARQVVGRKIDEIEGEGDLYKGSVTGRVLAERKEVSSVAYILKKDKEVLVTGTPLFDEDGEIDLVICTTRDLTELKALEQKLHTMTAEQHRVRAELTRLRRQQIGDKNFQYESPAMAAVVELVHTVAERDVTVLLTGESGTGKEVVAGMLYQWSPRKGKPFIKVNCAAIPAELLESELFGYEAGAFTGAKSGGKTGLFTLANGGVLLLDEVGELPLPLQSKLLRVLQEREVVPVGGNKAVSFDFRLIASTNRNLQDQVAEGTFRRDLFYRLNVVPVALPPLRERKEDVAILAQHFCETFAKKHGRSQSLHPGSLAMLLEYDWPGNVRELENLIERLVVTNVEEEITPNQVYRALYGGIAMPQPTLHVGHGLKAQVQAFERGIIEQTLEQTGSYRKAAKVLGVDHSTLAKKCRQYKVTGIAE